LSGVAIVQSGSALPVALTNATNVFEIGEDRAQLIGTCSKSQLLKGGSIGNRLNGYFNKCCFTTPPIIGADRLGTTFGGSGTGIVDGPGQVNLDLSISKPTALQWPEKGSSLLEFRAEFFNASTTRNSLVGLELSSATFRVIISTALVPR